MGSSTCQDNCRREKNLLALPGIEPQFFCRPACSLFTILTELSRLFSLFLLFFAGTKSLETVSCFSDLCPSYYCTSQNLCNLQLMLYFIRNLGTSQTHVMIVNLFVLALEAGVRIRAGFGPCLRLTRARWTLSQPTAANTVYASCLCGFANRKRLQSIRAETTKK